MNVEQYLLFKALLKIKALSNACDKGADGLIRQVNEAIGYEDKKR